MNTQDTYVGYEAHEYDDREFAEGYRRGPRNDRSTGMNVGDAERLASVIAGAGLLAFAARHRRVAALAAGALGTGLIMRGMAGRCPVYRAAHTGSRRNDTREALGGARGVHVHKTMTINRPVEDVYRFWRDLSNLPRAMRHLESVTPLGNGRSHWAARGPAGLRVEWDAEIINEEENRVIGWRSLEQADVVSAGSVTFRPATHGGTEISVRLQYEPPAGRVGAFVARLFGEEPSQQIEDDLRRVKQFLETGEVPTTEGQSDGRGGGRGPDRTGAWAAGGAGQGGEWTAAERSGDRPPQSRPADLGWGPKPASSESDAPSSESQRGGWERSV